MFLPIFLRFCVGTDSSASIGPTIFHVAPLSSDISKCMRQPLFSVLDGHIIRPFTYSGLFLIGPKKPFGNGSRLPQLFPPSCERTSQPDQSLTFSPILKNRTKSPPGI